MREFQKKVKAEVLFNSFILLIFCVSCSTVTEPEEQAGIYSFAPSSTVEYYNGLGIALNISPRKYQIGDEYTLEIVLTNLSEDNKTIWASYNKIDIYITDYNWAGKTVSYYASESISSHNMSLNQAWQQDVYRLKPGENRIFKKRMGRNTPGKMQFVAIYSNNYEEVTMLRYSGRDNNYKPEIPMETRQQPISLWTGKLVSKPIEIEFTEK